MNADPKQLSVVNPAQAPATQAPAATMTGELAEVYNVATIFMQSGLFTDVKSKSQAMVKIMAGKEMGLGSFDSMRSMNIIQGKVTMTAELMARRVKASGVWDYYPVHNTESLCALQFTKHDKPVGEPVTFNMDDATRMGLAGKDNWKKQPAVMLFWRCFSKGARMHCPHLIGGAYLPDEISETQATAKVVELNHKLELEQNIHNAATADNSVSSADAEFELELVTDDA